jgi:hypothetical protein
LKKSKTPEHVTTLNELGKKLGEWAMEAIQEEGWKNKGNEVTDRKERQPSLVEQQSTLQKKKTKSVKPKTLSDENHMLSEFFAFFGVSQPFFFQGYKKFGEFMVYKHSQGRMNDNVFQKCIKSTIKRWQKRWMVVDKNNIWYYGGWGDAYYEVRDCMSLDVDSFVRVDSVSDRKVYLEIQTNRRQLRLKLKDLYNGLYCIFCLLRQFETSEYCKVHFFQSFAPKRALNGFEYFVDGKGYFRRLLESFEAADTEILICGWMISPEMPLLREVPKNFERLPGLKKYLEEQKKFTEEEVQKYTRLDEILNRKAQAGCSIYVLVYKEFNVSMYNDSEHAWNTLRAKHRSIKVMRHPNDIVSLWSHHEKMVIVDRKTCFLGGFDITWGRWDRCSHDLHLEDQPNLFPGVDFYNPLVKDIVKGREWKLSLVEPSTVPRMPWHDVGVMVEGPVVDDFVYHYRSYWNNTKETGGEKEVLFTQMIRKDAEGDPVTEIFQTENFVDLLKSFTYQNIQGADDDPSSAGVKKKVVAEEEKGIEEAPPNEQAEIDPIMSVLGKFVGGGIFAEVTRQNSAISELVLGEDNEELPMEKEDNPYDTTKILDRDETLNRGEIEEMDDANINAENKLKDVEEFIDAEEKREAQMLFSDAASKTHNYFESSNAKFFQSLDKTYARSNYGAPVDRFNAFDRPPVPQTFHPEFMPLINPRSLEEDWPGIKTLDKATTAWLNADFPKIYISEPIEDMTHSNQPLYHKDILLHTNTHKVSSSPQKASPSPYNGFTFGSSNGPTIQAGEQKDDLVPTPMYDLNEYPLETIEYSKFQPKKEVGGAMSNLFMGLFSGNVEQQLLSFPGQNDKPDPTPTSPLPQPSSSAAAGESTKKGFFETIFKEPLEANSKTSSKRGKHCEISLSPSQSPRNTKQGILKNGFAGLLNGIAEADEASDKGLISPITLPVVKGKSPVKRVKLEEEELPLRGSGLAFEDLALTKYESSAPPNSKHPLPPLKVHEKEREADGSEKSSLSSESEEVLEDQYESKPK